MTKNFFKTAFWLSLLAILLWLGGFGAFLVKADEIKLAVPEQKTDAIIVLTGGPDRINTGLDLLQERFSGRLFISGVDKNVSASTLLSMWGKGVPCCITLGHDARNTRENAAESRDWMAKENIHTARLITSYYHMPRALMEMRHAMPDAVILPHPLNAEKESLVLGFEEYNKTLLTWLRIKLLK